MFWNRKEERAPWKPEWEALAVYNSEKSRGILHTEAWQQKMAELQKDFDREQLLWAHRNGMTLL